ncbi:hypothetical protein A7X67_02050 [Clostridium sp. W14A]|nr:hypothetical protein A7X67_02050 [Clostridium sp. W14A]
MKKRILSVILILAMAFSLSTTAFAATPDNDKDPLTDRIKSFVETKIDAANAKITISETKPLLDFAGNKYDLVECSPTGYYIIHPESGIVVESATNAKSPYKGFYSNLYYGGPTYYYVKSDKGYVHTIEGTTITDVDAASEQCNEINSKLISQANIEVADYIKGKSSKLDTTQSLANLNSADYWVVDHDWFSYNSVSFGYVDGGYCGYVASNLILKYWNYVGGHYLPSQYASISSTTLTNELIAIGKNLGYGAATWASQITNVINTFCNQNSLSACSSWHAGTSGMINEISTYQRPIILFGNLANAGNHAVVAYGYNEYENPGFYTFVCHYGWDGYADIHIYGGDSVFGSNTQYNADWNM